MMRRILFLTIPLLLPSCLPQVEETGSAPSNSQIDERFATQTDRLARLETELHEMRLLFTNQLRRIEEVAAQNNQHQPSASATQPAQPQQVLIMPQTPVVTHRWDSGQNQTPQHSYTAPQVTTRSQNYRIQPGDTLSEIAEQYQVSLTSLMKANAGIDPRRIRPGQSITLPGHTSGGAQSSANRGSSSNNGNYTVRPGDTLSQIAERYQVSLQSLLSSNPSVDPRRLRIGKGLQIPSSRTAATQSQARPQTRYSSPAADSLQTAPEALAATNERVPLPLPDDSAVKINNTREPTRKVLVRIPYNKSLGEIAEECGTDVATLNRLNHSSLAAESRVPANNAIYVPDFS